MSSPPVLLRVAARPIETLSGLASRRATDHLRSILERETELDQLAPSLGDELFAAAGAADPDSGSGAARARLAVVALRRSVFNRRPISEQQLAAAAQLLSAELGSRIEVYVALRRSLDERLRKFSTTYLAELDNTRRKALELARDPDFETALRLVGAALLERVRTLGDPKTWRHDQRLVSARLVAYLARGATKTSPNGLFCATALAGWGGSRADEGGPAPGVRGENSLRLDVLLNVTEARKVASFLGGDPEVWPALVPRINPTLVEDEEAWTFWSPASLGIEGNDEVFRRIKRQPVAELFVRQIAEAPRPVPELLHAVATATGAPTEALSPFFARLAEAGLLTRDIDIPYSTRRPLAFVAETVRRAGCHPPWLDELEAVDWAVTALASCPPETRVAAMHDVARRCTALPHRRDIAEDELFRIDAATAFDVSLPGDILAELRGVMKDYARLFGRLYPRAVMRRNLAQPFLRLHPPDHDVPLLEIYQRLELQEPPRERPTAFPQPQKKAGRKGADVFAEVVDFFADRATTAAETGRDEVQLSDGDWAQLCDGQEEPPWAAGVLFQVAAKNVDELAAGRYRVVLSDLFTGVGVALARFAHLHAPPDPAARNPIVDELERASRHFAREGAILAEVTFNPWGRTSNAGLRIPFLEHEIELLGERASPGKTVIPLSELTLRWSSAEERLVLHWVGQGVEVVPVISNGVAPEGFISLLAAIGRQNIQPLSYFPGFESEGVVYWPRFTSGRVVLFRRRWLFSPGTAPEPPNEKGKPDRLAGEFFARVHRWRHLHGLPRHLFVHTTNDPKPYYVDLESPLLVTLLMRSLTPSEGETPPTLYASEMLPGPEDLWVADRRGHYASEFLVQMGREPGPEASWPRS